MRNGGLQQFIVITLFVVFALVDLLGRWLRSRGQRGGPGERGPMPTEIDRAEAPAPAPRRGRLPAAPRAAPVRATAARGASTGPSMRDRRPPDGRRSVRATTIPALDAADARRAIVAMTILGPCRALE
jgi:hypothetical protein